MRLLLPAIALALFVVPAANAGQDTDSASGGTAQVVGRQRPSRPPSGKVTCTRHQPVGFFTQPGILGELGQVYANCYPQPACTSPTNPETIQIDGFSGDPSKFLFHGLSTTTFSETEQDAMIAHALSLAANVTPAGKVITNITFLQSIIVGNDPVYYQIYFTVTFAICSPVQKGMTWNHTISNAQTGTITVGCNGCNPYHGDTVCTQPLPLLCIFKPVPPAPPQVPAGVDNSDLNNQWSGGVVATTAPHVGTFSNITAVNSFCAAQFGQGWRVAEFHDGWGWNFQAYGGTVSAPAVPSTRFWVHINDQPANCW